MPYSLKHAADTTGKTKPTILRAIQSGKISAKKDEHGEWKIDPAELHRVYPPVSEADTENDTRNDTELSGEAGVLRAEVELLREILAERDRRVADKDAVIEDLRTRLDAESEERRRTQAQLTALLTNQRQKSEPEQSPPTSPAPHRRRWWPFGKPLRPPRSTARSPTLPPDATST